MGKINQNQKAMLGMLNGAVDSYDYADEVAVAQNPAMLPQRADSLRVGKLPGNPPADAQFDINLVTIFATVAGGVYTVIAPAALNAALKTKLAAFVFNQSDYAGAFVGSQGQFPLNGGWVYDLPFIYGVGAIPVLTHGVPDATILALLQKGDLVIPYYASVGGTDYAAFMIVRCNSVAYGKLLDSLSSDRFWINNIRYVLADTSAASLLQYNNQLFIMVQTLFGKFKKDSVSPSSNKLPEQFQAGIVDNPIKQGFDKNCGLALYVKYDVQDILLSVFVPKVDKVMA